MTNDALINGEVRILSDKEKTTLKVFIFVGLRLSGSMTNYSSMKILMMIGTINIGYAKTLV